MEWSKIKTILICVFAVVNIFLFSVYLKNSETARISDGTISETVQVLAQNNVTIDKSLIKKNYENVKVCNVENAYADIQSMLISCVDDEYIPKDEVDMRKNSFSYVPKKGSPLYNLDISKAAKALEKAGLIEKGKYTSEKDSEGIYFYLNFEDKVFFDSFVFAKAEDGMLCEIYALNILGDTVSEGSVAKTVSLAEILINFATSHTFESKNITDLRPGYCIGSRDETVRASASPVWRIKTSDGEIFYYDMRNGDLLD